MAKNAKGCGPMLVEISLMCSIADRVFTQKDQCEKLLSFPEPIALVERMDKPGFAVVRDERLEIYTDTGKLVSSRKRPKDASALYISPSGEPRYANPAILFSQQADGERKNLWTEFSGVFSCQGATILQCGEYATLAVQRSMLTVDQFGNLSSIASNATGDRVAYLTCPVSASILRTYRRVEDKWFSDTGFITPHVPGIGHPSVIEGMNGSRFVSKNSLAYLGGFASLFYEAAGKLQTYVDSIPKLDVRPRKRFGQFMTSRGFLFVTNVADGSTKAILSFEYRTDPERMSFPAMSSLVLSTDQKTLFVMIESEVWRVSVEMTPSLSEEDFANQAVNRYDHETRRTTCR